MAAQPGYVIPGQKPGRQVSCDTPLILYFTADIFNGEYGSVEENQLEQVFDNLMDQKQRISVANYKWTQARVLLQHAVNQLAFSVHKWKELMNIPVQ